MAHRTRTAPRAAPRVRREREREIVAATRLLFDERGLQDAPIEDIARAVGINKALIYRHFSSKEELFVLTLTELSGRARRAAWTRCRRRSIAVARLEEGWRRYTDFCLEYPAFLDCGLSLMRRPAEELRESDLRRASGSAWVRAWRGAWAGSRRSSPRAPSRASSTVEDPDFTANHLYTQTLGTMHLARIGIGCTRRSRRHPGAVRDRPRQVQEACIADVLASVGAPPRPGAAYASRLGARPSLASISTQISGILRCQSSCRRRPRCRK